MNAALDRAVASGVAPQDRRAMRWGDGHAMAHAMCGQRCPSQLRVEYAVKSFTGQLRDRVTIVSYYDLEPRRDETHSNRDTCGEQVETAALQGSVGEKLLTVCEHMSEQGTCGCCSHVCRLSFPSITCLARWRLPCTGAGAGTVAGGSCAGTRARRCCARARRAPPAGAARA